MSWVSHPAREKPVKLGLVLGITTVFCVIFWFLAGPFWVGITLVVVFLSLYSFWVPTTYTLDHEGIEVRRFLYKRRFEWSRFRRWELDENGIFLGTFSNPSRLDPWRGLYLLGANKHPEAVEMVSKAVDGG